MTRSALSMRVTGRNLPGLRFGDREPVHVGVQRGKEVVGLVRGDAAEAVFDLTVDVVTDGDLDFRGPYVHGRRGERFLYLSWGVVTSDGAFEMFRRAKLHLSDVPQLDVARVTAEGGMVEGRLDLTDSCGGPLCASVHPPHIAWGLHLT